MNQPAEWKVGGFFRGSFDKNHLNKTTCQDPAKDILLELVGEKNRWKECALLVLQKNHRWEKDQQKELGDRKVSSPRDCLNLGDFFLNTDSIQHINPPFFQRHHLYKGGAYVFRNMFSKHS